MSDWTGPYGPNHGDWWKGNLHAHTSPASGCATIPMQESLDRYVACGYRFLAVSDHLTLSEPLDPRLVYIPGIEWNDAAGGCHTGVYSTDLSILERAIQIDDHATLLDALAGDDTLLVLNHPNWQLTPHYRREMLLERTGYDGVEVYNGVIEVLEGSEFASDKWDLLLQTGRRVWGYASDDSHAVDHIGRGAVWVQSPSLAAADLLQALKQGRFYASSGVVLDRLTLQGSTMSVHCRQAQEIRLIGQGGCVLYRTADTALEVDLALFNSPYVRCEVYGHAAQMAWTQPVFRV